MPRTKTRSQLVEEWKDILDHEDYSPIAGRYKKGVMATLLENESAALRGDGEAVGGMLSEDETPINVSQDLGGPNSNNTTNVSGYDPVMISLVRRSFPNLVAYDVAGVQPMTAPTGLIFALRSKLVENGELGDETFYDEVNSAYSGKGSQSGNTPATLNQGSPGNYDYGTGLTTEEGEYLGTDGGMEWKEMGFSIEKVTVTARTRALKASYTTEIYQDLKNVHGLDAEQELSTILQTEILAELNREILRTIYVIAKPGCQNTDLAQQGTFDLDVDSNGRWAVEKFKGLLFQIEREANAVARETRRGRGNIIICSSDVASALAMAGVLDYSMVDTSNLEVDDTGNTFAGILNKKYRVYIDPYAVASSPTPEADAGHNFFLVGYRGASQFDAGLFYAPYVPLMMHRALVSRTFQPSIGYKTRYGMVANPFAEGKNRGLGRLEPNSNVYYRRSRVTNLTGTAGS